MADWHAATAATTLGAGTDDDNDADDSSFRFISRRSPVLCRRGCVASSQPLAGSIGLDLLMRRGANAAETAIAVAAALAVTEPCSTGLGGDMFCLHYDNHKKEVTAINGSGKSPAGLTRELVQQQQQDHQDESSWQTSALAVTVPGAARGWEDLLKTHGSGQFSLLDLVEPAAQLAEEGFPVAPVTSHHWNSGMSVIRDKCNNNSNHDVPLTVNGKDAPKAGEVFCNPDLARVLRELGRHGATEGFYRGATGRAMVEAVQKHGGVLEMDDLARHTSSTFPDPISATYRGIQLWEVPPNGQGVAGLIALSGLQRLEEVGACPNITPSNIDSADAFHVQMEMMRLGFQDARDHVACPEHMRVTNEWLVDPERIGSRAERLFDLNKATIHGDPSPSSCTVSFQVVDTQGNAISFVNSNFMGFGTGIVPDGCGFTLQNRGAGFSLDPPDHPNAIGGGKRPYHTIIPGMLTHADTGELYATISNMGGNMQPQGHLQLTVDMVAGGLDPQAAVDRPRFCIADGTRGGMVYLETGVAEDVVDKLKRRGHHNMRAGIQGHARSLFGRAQIIKRDRTTGVLWAASDGRADGCAMGY